MHFQMFILFARICLIYLLFHSVQGGGERVESGLWGVLVFFSFLLVMHLFLGLGNYSIFDNYFNSSRLWFVVDSRYFPMYIERKFSISPLLQSLCYLYWQFIISRGNYFIGRILYLRFNWWIHFFSVVIINAEMPRGSSIPWGYSQVWSSSQRLPKW